MNLGRRLSVLYFPFAETTPTSALLISIQEYIMNSLNAFLLDEFMAMLTVRNLPNEVHPALRVRAAQHGHSTEAEVRGFWQLRSSQRRAFAWVMPCGIGP